MRPETSALFDEAHAALARLERSARRMGWTVWGLYPPLTLFLAYFATGRALEGDWFWFLDGLCIAWLAFWAHKVELECVNIKRFITEQRRKLAWAAKIHEAEEYRLAHSEEGKSRMKNGPGTSGIFAVKVFCPRHGEQFERAGASVPSGATRLSSCFMASLLLREQLPSPQALEQRVNEIVQGGGAACCYLGDKAVTDIIANTPKSTGDARADAEAAEKEIIEPKAYGPEQTN